MSESLKNERIFIIDDEPANLKLVDKLLRSQGYQGLVLIDDPRDVVDVYRGAHPDLILLDINMPHLDGFEVIEQLKALNDPLLPPIIMLTAQSGKPFLTRALQAGARDYVTKPFDRNELLMRVRNLLDAHLAHRMMYNQRKVLDGLVRLRTEQLRTTQLSVIRRLAQAAEYRDEETGYHIIRMSHISALIARSLGWDEARCELLLNASPMHDVGKIGVPDQILKKPGKLDPDEWDVMKSHTQVGARLLEGDDSELMRMAHEIALTHHERWDGKGYPNGLAGEAIPLTGRIASVADVFDALTSKRPYKKAWSVEEACALIDENSGTQFDPEVVKAFHSNLPKILEIRQRYAEA